MRIPTPKEESYYPSSWDRDYITSEARSIAARFRFASAFKGCSTKDDIGDETKAGYDSLLRLILFQSAFEKFQALSVGEDEKALLNLEAKYCRGKRKEEGVAKIVNCFQLLQLLEQFTNGKKQLANIESFQEKHAGSFFLLARSIRNSFIHGHLAAGSWSQKPLDGAKLYHFLSDLIWMVMDQEMGEVMRTHWKHNRGSFPNKH